MQTTLVVLHALVLATACGGSTSTEKGAGAGGNAANKGSGGGAGSGGAGGTNGQAGSGGAGTAGTGGADAGFGNVGAGCLTASDCAQGCSTGWGTCTCIAGVPGGYCSEVIAECPALSPNGACPIGSTCVNAIKFGGQFGDLCLKNCATDGDCRPNEGYLCCPGQGGAQAAKVCGLGPCK